MSDRIRAEITGIASVDGETVDHEETEIDSESVIRSDGPIVIELLGAVEEGSR